MSAALAVASAPPSVLAADSIVKSKLRGELRELWQRNIQEEFSPMLTALDDGVAFKSLFTIGDTLNGYTPPGILDGMGAYKLNASTVRVLVNHELLNFRGYEYIVNGDVSMRGARVSFFDIDIATREVVDTGMAYDTVIDADGDPVSDLSFLQGFSGFSRFCSGRLLDPPVLGQPYFSSGSGVVDRIYVAPEEDGGFFNTVGGAYWGLDVENKELWSLAALGRGSWENLAPIDTGDDSTTGFVLTDDLSPYDFDDDGDPEASPLYLYIGQKTSTGNSFLARNGLAGGDLYVLKLIDGRTRPSQFRGAGSSASARWVQIDNSKGTPDNTDIDGFGAASNLGYDAFGFPTQGNLVLKANGAGSFGFSRPEGTTQGKGLLVSTHFNSLGGTDIHENPNDPTTVVLASTGVDSYDEFGSTGSDTFGTLYKVSTDFEDLSATITILYDGNTDIDRQIRSPDNLVWTTSGDICVTEDEAEEESLSGEVLFGEGAHNPNEAGIVCIDASGASLTRLANIDRNVIVDPSIEFPNLAVDQDSGRAGEWESSGIIEVTDLFGSTDRMFLVDVQAHGIDDQDEVNAQSRINDDDLVEGGQLILLTMEAGPCVRLNYFSLRTWLSGDVFSCWWEKLLGAVSFFWNLIF